MSWIKKAIEQYFCVHDLRVHSSNRCKIIRKDGSEKGEVTLTLYTCSKCEKDILTPSDKVYYVL